MFRRNNIVLNVILKAHLQLVVHASTTGLRAKNGKFPCDAHARRARSAAIRVRVDLLYDKIWNNSKTFYTTRVVGFSPCLEAPTCRVGATYASPARSVDLYAGNIGKISAWIDKFLYVFHQNKICFHLTHIPNIQHVGHAYVARTHRTWST